MHYHEGCAVRRGQRMTTGVALRSASRERGYPWQVADRRYFRDRGQIVGTGTLNVILTDPHVDRTKVFPSRSGKIGYLE